MGKGVMLKGRGNENIYPVTASDLVYDPITKKNVKEELGGKVEEAPKNDKQYARVNGTWAEVEAGAVSEVALITLTPAVAELNGVSVKVTTNEGETLLNTTWQGAQLSVQVRAGLQYTVAVGSKDGFIAPQSVTYTAVKGATRTINMAYTESRLKVNILSNQGSDSAISSVKATVKYGSTSVQVANGGMVNLPLNVAVTITFPDVNGYKKPETISYTHTSGSYEKSGTYQTEIVSVTLSADNGQSVNGQIVTINGTQHTWNGTAITQKVAFGTKYTVSVNDKGGYTKPADQTFTANQLGRNVDLVYIPMILGTFIQDIYGNLYTEEEWDGNVDELNGIAVIAENCQFVIAMENSPSKNGEKTAWGNDLVEEASVIQVFADANNDFSGEQNSNIIYKALGNDALAVSKAMDFIFPNGQRGYLGAAGEWAVVQENYNTIDSLISNVGSYLLNGTGSDGLSFTYWTSTQYNANGCWMGKIGNNGKIAYQTRANLCYIRPFAPYIANPKFIKFSVKLDNTDTVLQLSCLEGTTWGQFVDSNLYKSTKYNYWEMYSDTKVSVGQNGQSYFLITEDVGTNVVIEEGKTYIAYP